MKWIAKLLLPLFLFLSAAANSQYATITGNLNALMASTAPSTSNNIRTVEASDNWSFANINTALTAGAQATVTVPSGPVGIDTGGLVRFGGPWGQYQIRITDGAKSETVYVIGGTCAAGVVNCTLIFTPYFSHGANAYTLGSATQGIQEAINDGCGLSTAWTWYKNGKCRVVIPPTIVVGQDPVNTAYNIYGSIFFHNNYSILSGYGAEINHYGRGPALVVGYLMGVDANGNAISNFPAGAASNMGTNDTIEGLSFRAPASHTADAAYQGSLIVSTRYDLATYTNTITTAAPHNLRTGDMVTIMFTDNNAYWGDVPSITVTSPTTFTYIRKRRKASLGQQTTPGLVALNYSVVLDNATGTHFIDVRQAAGWMYGSFNTFFDLWDDEACTVEKFSAVGAVNANPNWSGSYFYSGGALNLPVNTQQLAPVLTVRDSSITANYSNGFYVVNSNGVYVHDTVLQATGPFQANVGTTNGNYQGGVFDNIYSESGTALNPVSPAHSPWPGLGVAGLIANGGSGWNLRGSSFTGALPTVGSGSTTYVYSIVVHDATTNKYSSPMPATYGKSNGSGPLTIRWPRVAVGTDVIKYDLIRNVAPSGKLDVGGGNYVAPNYDDCTGGNAGTCGSVAVDIPQCTGFICSHADDTGAATTPYTTNLLGNSFSGAITFWPNLGAMSTVQPIISDNEVTTFGVGLGPFAVSNFTNSCYGYINVFGGHTECLYSSAATKNTLLLAENAKNDGSGPNKGRLNFGNFFAARNIITLWDSKFYRTRATTTYRPTADAGDAAIGMDQNNGGVSFGSPKSISNYINSLHDNASWKERLTSTLKEFKTDVKLNLNVQFVEGTPSDAVAGGAVCQGSKATHTLQCSFNNGPFMTMAQIVTATLTTTGNTTDNVTVTGMTSSGHCSLTPTNPGAAGGIASVYISAKTTNQITVTHTNAAGWTFDVMCSPQ